MPANLTPEFKKARERLRAAQSPEERLDALEEMLATIPKHKGTDKMQADIKRRIAKLRDAQGREKRGRSTGYDHMDREGAGQVALVGPPNTGKSSLLAALTNAHPEIGDYPYSTTVPVPGMMRFEDVPIQLIDLPPLAEEITEGWVYSLIRNADLCLLTFDATEAPILEEELEGIARLLEARHIRVSATPGEPPDFRTRVVPSRILLTKVDLLDAPPNLPWEDPPLPVVLTSSLAEEGLDSLRREVFDALRIVRIYTKLPGKPPDMEEPYTLPDGSTVLDAVRTVHREFVGKLKYVRIWGSGKFDGQHAPADHRLEDKDVIEIHLA